MHYPKVAADEAVDHRINQTVRHGHEMRAQIAVDEHLVLLVRFDQQYVGHEFGHHGEQLQRGPANDEEGHDQDQYFDDLQWCGFV